MEDSLHIFRRFARINVNARCSSRYKVKNFLVDRMAFNGLHYLYLKHACDNICKLQMFRNGVIYTMACLLRRSCVTTDGLTTLYFFDFYEPMPIDRVEKQVTIFLYDFLFFFFWYGVLRLQSNFDNPDSVGEMWNKSDQSVCLQLIENSDTPSNSSTVPWNVSIGHFIANSLHLAIQTGKQGERKMPGTTEKSGYNI